MTTLKEEAKELRLKPYDWSCDYSAQHNTARVSPQRSFLCFTLPLLYPISYVLSLSSFSSHVILSPSQDQQAGNTSESCDRGAKNTAGVVFASLGTSPANSIKAWTCVFFLKCFWKACIHTSYLNNWLLSIINIEISFLPFKSLPSCSITCKNNIHTLGMIILRGHLTIQSKSS